MVTQRIEADGCTRMLRFTWVLAAMLVVVALLGFAGVLDMRLVLAANVLLGGPAMIIALLAAEHAGE